MAVGQAKEGISNESSVYIGIKDSGYEIPSLPAPQGGYTVNMAIESSTRDLSEDYKSKETEFASWLLRIEINNVYANPNDSGYYPELHSIPDEFCSKGQFRLWSSNNNGELLSLLIEDMRSEQNYQTKNEDGGEYLWYLIAFMVHREICGDDKDNNYDGFVDEGCAPYYLDKDNDGYGDPDSMSNQFKKPPGYVLNGKDCNDNNSIINPGNLRIKNTKNESMSDFLPELNIVTMDPTCPQYSSYSLLKDSKKDKDQLLTINWCIPDHRLVKATYWFFGITLGDNFQIQKDIKYYVLRYE